MVRTVGMNGYTVGEEIANSITHGLGVALSIAGLSVMVVLAAKYGNCLQVVTFSIFGAALILLFLASTLYHSLTRPSWKKVLKICDHSAIYVLIAGTYTPIMLSCVGGGLGWSIFGVVWGLALFGIVMKCFFTGRFRLVSTLFYIGMGWLCLGTLHQLIVKMPMLGIIFLFAGGVAYTAGAVFYVWKKLPYGHAIWHLFVLAGSTFHYFAILTLLP